MQIPFQKRSMRKERKKERSRINCLENRSVKNWVYDLTELELVLVGGGLKKIKKSIFGGKNQKHHRDQLK